MRQIANRGFQLLALAGLMLLTACIGPQGKPQDGGATYYLSAAIPNKPGNAKLVPTATMLISPMRAHPGFDTSRMAYLREPNRLEYFAHNQWVEAPARMLTPLVAQALEASSAYSAVVQASSSVATALRLDTELIHLAQDFSAKPSRMRLQVRAQLVDIQTQTIRAGRLFEVQAASASEDARGGVAALNHVLPEMLTQLAEWAAQASVHRP